MKLIACYVPVDVQENFLKICSGKETFLVLVSIALLTVLILAKIISLRKI